MLTTTAFAFFWHRFYLTGKNFADYRKDVASQKSYKFRLTKFILFSLFYSVAIYIAYFVISLFVGIFINYIGAILRYFLTNTYLINAIIVSLIFLITALMITFILASTLPYFPSLATRIKPLPLEILRRLTSAYMFPIAKIFFVFVLCTQIPIMVIAFLVGLLFGDNQVTQLIASILDLIFLALGVAVNSEVYRQIVEPQMPDMTATS